MTVRFMLDTNAVSMFMHGRSSRLDERVSQQGPATLMISAIGYGETRYGLAMQPDATRLLAAAEALFRRSTIMPWTEAVADRYGQLRADLRRAGRSLQPLDMLIAAHALEAGATLVSNDRAFRHVPGLTVEDWTA